MNVGDNSAAKDESLGNELANALGLGDMANAVNDGQESGDGQNQEQAISQEAEGEESQVGEELEAAQEDEGKEGNEDQGSEIRKFTDLTALFDEGVTAEDLYGLELVSGDGESLTVGQLKDHWQNRKAFEAEKAEFANERERQAKELEEARNQAAAQTGEFQKLPKELLEAEAEIKAIEKQSQGYDWEAIEKEDPGKAALLSQKFRNAYDTAVAKYNALSNEYSMKRTEAYRSFVAGQREKMLQRIPEWRESKTLVQEREAIDKLVANYGFTKQDMDSVVDPRLSHLLRDYMLLKAKFDNAVANGKEVRQRGNKVLRTTHRPKPKARLQQLEERARQPDATRQEKQEAMRAILSEAQGFL